MANGVEEEAEKAYRLAEERFLAGDLDAALRLSRNAKRQHSASFPALERALAAYEVHAAARGGGRSRDWHAVLGVRPPATHDAIKKQYKRMCLVLHPDKKSRARRPPTARSSCSSRRGRRSPPPPRPRLVVGTHRRRLMSATGGRRRRRTIPATGGGGGRPTPRRSISGRVGRRTRATTATSTAATATREAPPWHATDATRAAPPLRPAPRSRRAPGKRQRAVQQPRHQAAEARALLTHRLVAILPPRRDPPPPPRQLQRSSGGEFTCPTVCPLCGTPFSSLVGVGMCTLGCQACTYDAVVQVYSRDVAIAF